VPGLLLFPRMNCYGGTPFPEELFVGERRGKWSEHSE
jgi:hypothetical protein